MARSAGLYIDSSSMVHMGVMREGKFVTVSPIHMSDDLDVSGLRNGLAKLVDAQEGEEIGVVATGSDTTVARARFMEAAIAKANVTVRSWILPTEALCFDVGLHASSEADFGVLAVHLGRRRATVTLYDCGDGVLECLATTRRDVGLDEFDRCVVVSELVSEVNADSGDYLWRVAGGVLRTCVADVMGREMAVESAVRASLPLKGIRLERTPSLSDGVARGAAEYAGMLNGDADGVLLLHAAWFSVALQGAKGRRLVLRSNYTIPTRQSIVIDLDQPIGMTTHVVLAESDGNERLFIIPEEIRLSEGKVETTVDIDFCYHVSLEFRPLDSFSARRVSLRDMEVVI